MSPLSMLDNLIGSGASTGWSIGKMGGTGLTQSVLGIMQSILNGGTSGSLVVTGLMQDMLGAMDDFVSDFTSIGSSSSNVFQGMASAMNLAFAGSANAPVSFQPMLDAMHSFLSNATSSSFDAMQGTMQTFLAAETSGSSSVPAPFKTMLDSMQALLSGTAAGSTNTSGLFQTMLGAMQTVFNDTAALSGTASTHVISMQLNGDVQVTGTDGVAHMLTNVERLHFTDASVAMDINGNAGMTAKTLGLVFGADAVSNTTYAGMGLNLLDGGMSYQDLMQTALTAQLGPNFTTAAEVNLGYHNLFGTNPSASDVQYWANAVTSGQYTHASLAVMAAELSQNANNIHLVGLAHTGLEYLPVSTG